MLQILSGKVPLGYYAAIGAMVTAVVIRDERPPLVPEASPSGESYKRFWSTATKCWAKDPEHRPSMSEVIIQLDIEAVGLDGSTCS